MSAHVRDADPDTSRDAASSMEPVLSNECSLVVEAVRFIDLMGGHGATAWQIRNRLETQGIDRDQNCVASRCTQLRDAGLIEDRGDRRPGRSGRSLIVWHPTEQEPRRE